MSGPDVWQDHDDVIPWEAGDAKVEDVLLWLTFGTYGIVGLIAACCVAWALVAA